MIFAGSAGWNIPRAHKGRFPGEGTGLERYSARLNAAEINSSFYRFHAPATYARWAAGVPPGFRFSVKIPKLITHERGLMRAREPLERFLGEIAGLGDRLGPLLIQLRRRRSAARGRARGGGSGSAAANALELRAITTRT